MTYVYNSQLDAFTLYHIQEEESPSRSSISPALPALGHAISGASGTAISKLLIYPLDLVITRLQVQAQFQNPSTPSDADYTSLLDAATKIYNNEGGIAAFYSGVLPDTAKSVADSFLFFLAYNYLRSRRLTTRGGSARTLPALDEIAVGMLAGALSKLCTTPIQNIVTRKQTASMVASRDPTATASPDLSLKDIALQIRHEKGLQGFWSGYSASLVLTLNPAITFLLHKILLRALVPRARREDPGARVTFLVAALSKSVASAVTYPFSLAKTRAQVSKHAPTETVGQTSESSEKEVGKGGAAGVAAQARRARQRTVFSTILRVARTEGVAALYQGLGAEMLKGFFSHGLTMLMKDRIHGVVVSLYYLVLQTAQKYPTSEEIRAMAARRANGVVENGREMVGNASQYAGDVVANGKSQAGELYEKGREMAGNAAEQAKGVVGKGTEGAKGAKGVIGSGSGNEDK
ncbi:mitochondrial carrier [Lophium mytilinum]|uniref:Mitochondrial carrier n=1 Tax=Lophium mytilinum TaxID=390894 RepID=A0A6A6QKM8_9PEZI|nr:mitochondrial carrier [Lophium mytilinum]